MTPPPAREIAQELAPWWAAQNEARVLEILTVALDAAEARIQTLTAALEWALGSLGEYAEAEHDGDHTCGNPNGACDMTCVELAEYARQYAVARAALNQAHDGGRG